MYRDIYYVLAYIISHFGILFQPDVWVAGFHLLFLYFNYKILLHGNPFQYEV